MILYYIVQPEKHEQLLKIYTHIFCTFPTSVIYLWLNRHKLHKVQASDFKCLKNLAELHLENNGINTVSKGAFDHLSKLKTLKLNDHRLRDLPNRLHCEKLCSLSVTFRLLHLKSKVLRDTEDIMLSVSTRD